MASWLGQYCITVTDLERSVLFYRDVLGLKEQQRITMPDAREAILGSPDDHGTKIQLAQRDDVPGPIDHGNALWKIYLYCDDIEATFRAATAGGGKEEMAPRRLEKWSVIVAFVTDPDGYRIELLQRLEQ